MSIWHLKNNTKVYQLLKGRSNAYFIRSGNINILIDTGKANKKDELLKAIQSRSSRLDYLILTHTHFDHCQNAKFIQEKFNCKIVVGQPEYNFAKMGYTPLPKGTNPATKIISLLGEKIASKKTNYAPFSADIKIEIETQFLCKAANIEIIATPGHSNGSISVIVNNELALVGDTLFGIFKNGIFPPYADDTSELLKSWELLLKTKCNLFLPEHGGPIQRKRFENEILKN